MVSIAPTTGIGSDINTLHARNPALSVRVAASIAQKSGLDVNDPKNVVLAMHSDAYRNTMASGGAKPDQTQPENSSILSRFIPRAEAAAPATAPARAIGAAGRLESGLPFLQGPGSTAAPLRSIPGTTSNQSILSDYSAKEAAYQRMIDRETAIEPQLQAAIEQAGRMASFVPDSYRKQRITEMDPVRDIEDQMLKLRSSELAEKARMFEQLQGLPWQMQLQSMQNRDNVYAQQMTDLVNFRKLRMDDANAKIDDEIASYTGRVGAAKAKIDALQASLDSARRLGLDEEQLAQLRIDRKSEETRLQKLRAGNNNMPTTGEQFAASLAEAGYTDIAKIAGRMVDSGKSMAEVMQQFSVQGSPYAPQMKPRPPSAATDALTQLSTDYYAAKAAAEAAKK